MNDLLYFARAQHAINKNHHCAAHFINYQFIRKKPIRVKENGSNDSPRKGSSYGNDLGFDIIKRHIISTPKLSSRICTSSSAAVASSQTL